MTRASGPLELDPSGSGGLDGRAWHTPARLVVNRAEDFVVRVDEFFLEGVVAKRRDSSYLPGRRSTAWIKHKLRREERLAATGVRRPATVTSGPFS